MEVIRTVPEFVEPKTIAEMHEDEAYKFVNEIRERRMVLVALQVQAETARKQIKAEKMESKYTKLIEKIKKSIAKVDIEIEKATGYAAEIKGLRVQAINSGEDIE